MYILFYPIKGYEGIYSISKCGKVMNDRTNKIRKNHLHHSGYYTICLYNNGSKRYFILSRLLAINFIPNPEKKPEVNHINGRKTDDRLKNLEWVTAKENTGHRINVLKKHNKRKVIQFSMNGKKIRSFNSLAEAGKFHNLNPANLCTLLKDKGKITHFGGFKWKYA